MAKKLYVGNLPYQATEDQLTELFSQVGEVVEVAIIMDRDTGRSKGFGFVEMANEDEAEEAIKRFNGYNLDRRTLTVNEARPREERPRNPGSGGGGGGGGGRRDNRDSRDNRGPRNGDGGGRRDRY